MWSFCPFVFNKVNVRFRLCVVGGKWFALSKYLTVFANDIVSAANCITCGFIWARGTVCVNDIVLARLHLYHITAVVALVDSVVTGGQVEHNICPSACVSVAGRVGYPHVFANFHSKAYVGVHIVYK